MTDQVAPSPQSLCDHPVYVHHMRGGEPLTIPLCQICGAVGWDDLREQVAEHRRMVLAEAADDLHRVATHLRAANPDNSVAKGVRYAEARIRAQLTAAPPATLGAPVPAENAPAVPEEADGQGAGQGDVLTYAEMESERDRLAGEVFTLTNSESLDVVAAELERDEALADRNRLWAELQRVHAQVAHHQDVIEAAKAWRAMRLGTPTQPKPESSALIAAVDALSDAGTDQTEGDHG